MLSLDCANNFEDMSTNTTSTDSGRPHCPLVTVIIPCYNRDQYIKQAVDSVLSQDYSNVRLIVVDDGSTDDSRKILEEYGDKLCLLTHPGGANKGQSASINLGLEQSTGEYIAILDSDDWWAEYKLRLQVTFLESHTDVGLVYGNGYQTTASGEPKWRIYQADHAEDSDPARVLADCYFLVPNNSLVRRSVFDEVGGFDESLRAAQDHDIAIRIAEVTKIAYIPEVVFYYRRHADSISNKGTRTRWTNGFYILKKAQRRFPYKRTDVFKRKAVLHFRMGQVLKEEGSSLAAYTRFLLAFFYDPRRALAVLSGRESTSPPSV